MSTITSTSSAPAQTSTSEACAVDGKLQLFLGGSCNPTTWRQNVAIPFLETNGISYYNPQVDDWTPEIVNLERSAKQNAQLLLFVIDKQTRSTVSLVESAFIAGEGKNLVVVIYPLDYNVICLNDKTQQTSNFTKTTSKHTSTSLFMNTNQAELSCFVRSTSISQHVSSNRSSTVISSSSTNDPSSETKTTFASSTTTANLSSTNLAGAIRREKRELNQKDLREICEQEKRASSTVRINDETISSIELQELKLARFILQTLILVQDIPMFSDILQALKYISSSLKEGHNQKKRLNCFRDKPEPSKDEDSFTNSTFSNQISNDSCFSNDDDKKILRDIYLSLDVDDDKMLESSVLPILQESGLTYDYRLINNITKSRDNPIDTRTIVEKQELLLNHRSKTKSCVRNELAIYGDNLSDTYETTKLAVEQEISAIRSSRVLLFVITNRCRGLSIMILASHFMALFKNNVVLCVQYLEEPCSIGGETLTKSAIADYNRSRVYLCDYAIKSKVPVFSSIREAIECCSRKCLHRNKR